MSSKYQFCQVFQIPNKVTENLISKKSTLFPSEILPTSYIAKIVLSINNSR